MCEVCKQKLGDLVSALKPFIKKGVKVSFVKNHSLSLERVYLIDDRNKSKLILTADSDGAPSYFHWGNGKKS